MTMTNTSIPTKAAAVTASDTVDNFAVALYIGVGGDVAVVTEGGSEVTFSNVPSGLILPLRVNKVKATGTTATNIIRMW